MTVRVALIGCGFFARNHMLAWRDLPGAKVVAVCDLDSGRAGNFAAEFGAEAFTDPAVMLAEVRPDATDIVTTVASHRKLVTLAVQHSGAVICQKPFAASLTDGQAMVSACAAADVPLFVHENFRWQAPWRAVQARLAAGVVGTPRFLRLSFRHAFDIYTAQPYLAEEPDLALMDVGLHLFDMASCLMGDVVRVSCETQRLNPRVAGQDAFQALLRHSSGAVSSVECSFFAQLSPDPFPQTLGRVEGDAGTLEVLAGYRLRQHGSDGPADIDVEPELPIWGARPWHLIQDSVCAFQTHVLEVLAGRAQPQPSGADNLRTLAVTLAAIRAAKSGATLVPEGAAPG
ncbi:Gfo/Idh/MocA family protein [Paracoccus tibetensis]|uniref:Predicted dehydrogenase n=1 Tax=Paracoccus tibetensis TaxID=336292 RepID=A0A1G5HP25_9RHOB|nr:Gfo/Idh/MocA family oxidoreductase [Paracoccus tibetensis]SCY65209.1 Predicted dehydrogenase [Paracoccus tibetensis]